MTTFSKTTEDFFSLFSKTWSSTTYFLLREISNNSPNETNKSYSFRACYSKWVGHHVHLHLAEAQGKHVRERLYPWKKGSLQNALMGGYWPQGAGGGLTWAGYLMWLFWGPCLSFSGCLWIDTGWKAKNREAGSHWPSPDFSGTTAAEAVGQSFIVPYGLAVVLWYICSLALNY